MDTAAVEPLAKLLSAAGHLAWPLVAAALLPFLVGPLRDLLRSARGRKFTVKVAGNELTMEEANEQQRTIVTDLQAKVGLLERRLALLLPENTPQSPPSAEAVDEGAATRRILWVDDNPRNNSYLVDAIEQRGARVDIALSTDDGLARFKNRSYDAVLSDMGRPEGEKAGIDLARRIKAIRPDTPVYLYCGQWAATNWREEALQAGATDITSSATTLLADLALPMPR